MNRYIKNCIVGLALAFAPTLAAAACSAPTLASPTDLIIQLRSGDHGSGFIGTGESIGVNSDRARSPGAMYFDEAQGTILGCDGTDWVAMLGGGSGADGSNVSNDQLPFKSYPNQSFREWGATVISDSQIPASEAGKGTFTYKIQVSGYSGSSTHSSCIMDIELETGWVHIGSPYRSIVGGGRAGSSTVTESLYGTGRIVDNGDGTYTWNIIDGNLLNTDQFTGKFLGRFRMRDQTGEGCLLVVSEVARNP